MNTVSTAAVYRKVHHVMNSTNIIYQAQNCMTPYISFVSFISLRIDYRDARPFCSTLIKT